jgi:hypothetical protein
MIPDSCLEVHTSPLARPSVPVWFAEVVIVAGHLAKKELLDAFAHQVHLIRGRFGSYEPIDFLAVLIGYAISGEHTLADFFEHLEPFEAAFMALFGRSSLPHRSSLSRFLADVDRPCLEAFRKLFEQSSFAEGWTPETIGGIWDRQGRRYLVFDVDATRQATKGASAGKWSVPGPSPCKCIPVNGSAPMPAGGMAIIAASWPQRCRPSPPTWRTSRSLRSSLWFVSTDHMAMQP